MEIESAAQSATINIPEFKGLEKLNTIPALKEGSFREFLNKVMEIRQAPEKEKQAHDEIKKIDSDTTLSNDEKKSQLRAIDRIKLFAVIGKNIEFGENSLEITLDFNDLDFAEKQAIGAGDILPPNINKIAFEKKQNAKPIIGERTVGPNGREYRSKSRNYIASYTGTKLTIDYKDILTTTNEQTQKMDVTEKKSIIKAEEAVQTSQKSTKDLKGEIEKPKPIPAKAAETKEVGVSHRPVFIGDSQMEGMGSYYLRGQGIDTIDLRSMRMESIARTLEDPSKVDSYYKGKSEAFVSNRKNRIISGREKLKTADAIVLQCGGNNIVSKHSLQKMQSSLEKLIATIRTFNISAPIYVGMLMIRPETPDNSVSNQYNTWLRDQASKGVIRIVDSNKIVRDSGIKRPSGTHLDRNGYIHLAKQVLKAINYRKA